MASEQFLAQLDPAAVALIMSDDIILSADDIKEIAARKAGFSSVMSAVRAEARIHQGHC